MTIDDRRSPLMTAGDDSIFQRAGQSYADALSRAGWKSGCTWCPAFKRKVSTPDR